MYSRRILVLIPHPDDEVVGCCAAIGRARRQGAAVHGLFLTTGVPAADVLWPWQRAGHAGRVERRRRESERVAGDLGLAVAGRQDYPTRALRTHLAESRARLLETVERLRIDTLWTPAFEGGHQDHDAANALAATVSGPSVWEFAEYNLAGGRVRSQTFPAERGGETVLELDADEVSRKRAALAHYGSERGNLGFVATARECFRPLPDHDYREPPHAGRMFFARFQWVPFRHPRIDFTAPETVRRDIADFVDRHRPGRQSA